MFSCEICEFFQDTYLVEHLRTATPAYIFFLEVFEKFQKIFISIIEKIPLVYIVHIASECKLAQVVYLKIFSFSKKREKHC